MLSPLVRKYLASKRWPFKVLFNFAQRPWPPRTPWVQPWRCGSSLLAPKHDVSNSASRSGVTGTVKDHYTRYSTERVVNVMKRTPMERTSGKSGRITPWRYHRRYEKNHERHQAETSSLLLEKTVGRLLCMMSQKQSQSRKSWNRLWIWQKVGGEGLRDGDLGEIYELIDTTPEEWTEDNLTELNASKLAPDGEEEDLEEAAQKTNWR